jgi:hypothetical protein
VLADGLLVEERVESDHALHVRGTELESLCDELDHVRGNPALVRLLAEVKHRDASRHLVRVALEDLLELAVLLDVERKGHVQVSDSIRKENCSRRAAAEPEWHRGFLARRTVVIGKAGCQEPLVVCRAPPELWD